MDLSYGPEYEAFREEVRGFLKASWPPRGEDEKGSREEQVFAFRRRAIEAGYVARAVPRAYGGSEQEADSLKGQIIREEFGKVHAPGDARGIGTMMLVPTLLERGEEWQKEKWVPKSVMGEYIWCQGYSEPGSGSDLASLKTKGELVGDEWVINGQKIWTSNAQNADYMFCLVRTEPDAGKHAGISYLLIDMKQPGVDVRPLKQMTGTADFNEVFLTDVKTPADWIVGKRGEGWLVSRTTLKHERAGIGNAAQLEMVFGGVLALAKSAQRNGRPAIEDPSVRERLGRIEGFVKAHVFSGYRQLTADLRGADAGIIGTRGGGHSTNIGQEGAVPRGHEGWITQYMWSLGVAIAGGTANVQRNVIAERGLGLPRDAAAQRSK